MHVTIMKTQRSTKINTENTRHSFDDWQPNKWEGAAKGKACCIFVKAIFHLLLSK